ncbi:farnesol dehydrogenase-like [Onthophagus taurus]|uniref:farnesol dehydrogenase-like n=1 Tax=Onthophagus taurus TaxID=166361 RepID=UPI0039BE7E9A
MDLKEKVAIVTGASSGVGAATVKALLKLGMKVVGIARRKEKIEELRQNSNDKLFALKVDLRNPEEILNGFKWIEKNVGLIHVLINNAGIGIPTPIINGNIDSWKSVLDTNFVSVAITCRETIRIMQENNIQGYIINIGSVCGRYDAEGSIRGSVFYASSKHALMTLTENIRLELARSNSKIRITNLMPGVIRTGWLQANGFKTDDIEKIYSELPYLSGEDIAETILYLLSTPLHVHVTEFVVRPIGENFENIMKTLKRA